MYPFLMKYKHISTNLKKKNFDAEISVKKIDGLGKSFFFGLFFLKTGYMADFMIRPEKKFFGRQEYAYVSPKKNS